MVGDAEQQQRISSIAEIVETQFMLSVYAVRLLRVKKYYQVLCCVMMDSELEFFE